MSNTSAGVGGVEAKQGLSIGINDDTADVDVLRALQLEEQELQKHRGEQATRKKRPNQEYASNWCQQLWFTFMTPMISKGFQATEADIWDIYPHDKSEAQYTKLKALYDKHGNLGKAVFNFCFREWMWTVALMAGDRIVLVALPVILELFLIWYSEVHFEVDADGNAITEDPDYVYGWGLAMALALGPFISTLFNNRQRVHEVHLVTKLGAATTGLVYHKSITADLNQAPDASVGNVVNLMATDSAKIGELGSRVNTFAVIPVQIIAIMTLLYISVGPAAFAGLFTLLLSLVLSAKVMVKIGGVTARKLSVADGRIKLIHEVLQGIRLVKFYCWERRFSSATEKIREREVELVGEYAFLFSMVSLTFLLLPMLISVTTFGVYVADGNTLDAPVVFRTIALFNALQYPVVQLPMALNVLVSGLISIRRINVFLSLKDLDMSFRGVPLITAAATTTDANGNDDDDDKDAIVDDADVHVHLSFAPNGNGNDTSQQADEDTVFVIKDGNFKWPDPDPELKLSVRRGGGGGKPRKPADGKTNGTDPAASTKPNESKELFELRNINVAIKKGSLTAVVGEVASGKSSLLSALLGEMPVLPASRDQTLVKSPKEIGYGCQTAWIHNATFRNNIIMNEEEMDFKRYWQVLRDCALVPDLVSLHGGDKTELGEKGVNLSGGQKQRVSLARLAYSTLDTVMLDDPMSAVDSHVGDHIFEHCICKAMAGRTRVLVTNQLHILHKCDFVIVMDGGRIVEQGSYAELMERTNSALSLKIASHKELLESKHGELVGDEDDGDAVVDADADAAAATTLQSRQRSTSSVLRKRRGSVADTDKKVASVYKKGTKLVENEYLGDVGVGSKTYFYQFKSFGHPLWLVITMFALTFSQLCIVAGNFLLAIWSERRWDETDLWYMVAYICLVVLTLGSLMFRSWLYKTLCVRSSRWHHHRVLQGVLHAPVSLFDRTPVGRILNRFSTDMQFADLHAPRLMLNLASIVVNYLMALLAVLAVTWYFAVPLLVATVIYYFLQRFYRDAAVQFQRINAVTKSPVFQQISTTLTGLSTLRAFHWQDVFVNRFYQLMDRRSAANQMADGVFRWTHVRVNLVNIMLLLSLNVFLLFQIRTITPAMAGLGVTFIMSVGYLLGILVWLFAELHGKMTSIERLQQYSEDLPREPEWELPSDEASVGPSTNWPKHAIVEFKDVRFRYRADLQPALKRVSFKINPGEKVGICGRTGSGKSTIMLSLFRMYPIEAGSIEIDGVSVHDLGLHSMRSKLCLIPQDPVVFAGSIRSNLDPFSLYTDTECWNALSEVSLAEYVKQQDLKLDHAVQEYGGNLSQGQRQLLCIARAILKKPKLLLMDEASSSLDHDTDRIVQESVRKNFEKATVLTIAHRLHTIMDSDRILVVDAGEVAEFDTPQNLLKIQDGVFQKLYQAARESELDEIQ